MKFNDFLRTLYKLHFTGHNLNLWVNSIYKGILQSPWSKEVWALNSGNNSQIYQKAKEVMGFFNKYAEEPTLQEIVKWSDVIAKDLLWVGRYGSRVYGTTTEKSDYDYVVVSKERFVSSPEASKENANISIVSINEFDTSLQEHQIRELECLWLSPKDILFDRLDLLTRTKSIDTYFGVDLKKLRHSISEKASHSFVKAKKKFIVPADKNIYAGKKSLFHSLRILNFGAQIAKDGRISDYGAANNYFTQIMNDPSEDWEHYRQIYKPIYNSLATEFRKLAPLENDDD